MRRWAAILGLVLCTSAPGTEGWQIAVQGLRTYCKACHGVGELRFLYSNDDREVWEYLFDNDAPNARIPWARAIEQVLSWPSDSPPPADQWMAPPDRDWMPKGVKRHLFARQTVGGTSLRRFILEELKHGP